MALNDRTKIVETSIDSEMKTSYIDYSMSVIVSRALPDVRDGLKPSQRRILVAMNDLNLAPGRPYRKCAKIAGDTSGNYHPHGEQVVYPTLVRLAQDWVMRYPLVDGQGNFGCFTGDTRIRLLDGTERSFEQLAALGPDARFHVYSVDKAGRIVVGEGRNARITRRAAALVEVELDTGETIRCTPDHRFLLRDNTYKQARDLMPDDSLMPGYFDTAPVKEGLNDYLRVFQPSLDRWDFVHRLADEFNAEHGRAKSVRGPFVRHHVNFNRWDNRPENIERMSFLEHLHLHADQIGELWKDDDFRTTQRQGVQRYYDRNPEAREVRRRRFAEQNRSEAFRRENGRRVAASNRERLANDPAACAEIARRMKALWADPAYRARMSVALANVEKRPLTPEEKQRVARIISEKSRVMWSDAGKRREIVAAISRALASDEVRAKLRETGRSLWTRPEYRDQFPADHFANMARAAWQTPGAVEKHRAKLALQWDDAEFRNRQQEGVRRANERRMSDAPTMMQDLAAKAAQALRRNWRDPEYGRKVIRTRVARYVSGLLAQGEILTPDLYESRRPKWTPRLESALVYFKDFDEIVAAGRTYNHRIVAVRPLTETADVYDITVDTHHNFLLSSGVFVHNSVDGDAPAAMRYCVAGQTLIASPAGTVRIDALAPGIAPNSDCDVHLSLFDHAARTVHASKLFHSGDHPTHRLRTREGFELIGTRNHPLLCLVDDAGVPRLSWKLMENIAAGDRVVISRTPRPLGARLTERERQTAVLLGAFISEGFISESRAGFNNIDREYFESVVAAYDAVVGGPRYLSSRRIASGSELFELDIHNLSGLRRSPLGELEGKAKEKRVPDSVWRARGNFKRAFLQSLFHGDGSSSLLPRHTIQVSYSTCSEQLARDVQLLLLEFGVIGRICRYEKGEYKVVLTNRRDARRFAGEVGFLGRKQEKLLRELSEVPEASSALSHDHVPFLAEYVRSQPASWRNRDWLKRHNIDRIERWERGGTAILDRIESAEARRIPAPLATADYYYAEVESVVDAGVRPVYSVRVDTDEHAFVTNGFVSHNTEARLTALAVEMLNDLEKNTVDFRPNYDETREEPVVLPSVVPNLLINGCSGIAVGMTTEVPPHNLGEICDAIVHVIDHPEAEAADLLKIVSGPDFPTGGIINGTQGIRDCYLTGRGLIKMRARVQVEEGKAGRMSLVATEIPFQVNKGALLEKIAELVRDGKVAGISDLRDESDRDGMRIVIELKKDANPKVVLNQLFVHTPLQTTFGAIMLGLVNQRPQVLTLRALVGEYVAHRQIVVRRRTEFDLAEAEKRAHILEGLKIALDHLDAVIALIRAAKDVETARTGLMAQFKLSEIQSNAILEMRLARLTALERGKIEQEYLEVIQLIETLRSILASPQKMLAIIQDEVRRLKEKYGDPRKTQIIAEEGEIGYEDTIEQKDMVITISHAGYIKRQEISAYRSQRRGGKGVIGARTKEEDYLEHLFIANTHAYLLFLTDKGRCYWLKVHEVEQAGRMARGRPLVNHLEGLSREERVQAVVAVKEFDDQHFLVCATKKGLIKKTVLSAYSHPQKGGIKAILLEDGDALIEAIVTDGTQDMVVAKKKGLAVRFHESEVRSMGRTSYGVKATTLDEEGDEVVSMVGVKRQATLLTVCENGYGKRSEISEYRLSHRGGKGIITIKTTERNGDVVAVKEVVDTDELMIITRSGQLIRMPVAGISVIGRNTQGVKLVNLTAPEGELPVAADTVAGVTRVVNEDDAGGASGEAPAGNGAAGDAGADDAGAGDDAAGEAPPDGPEESAH